MLNGKSLLVTGGTGSFGRHFVAAVLARYPSVQQVVVFSRDEMKQLEMRLQFPESQFPQLRFEIGDVRDAERIAQACQGMDIVIHAAALKHVPVAERHPMEAIKTNIHGAENVVRAALLHGVPQVVALSSDKAAAPTNLYGATKLASDKLFIHANSLTGGREQRFSVVRYGNVLGSRGSVVPLFLQERHTGRLTLTHPEMTRFSITLDQEVETVLHALQYAWGGELFVPKIPSFRLTDLAEAIGPQCERIYTGVRPGEKLHEDMITPPDALLTVELADYYVVLPSVPTLDRTAFKAAFDGRDVPTDFCYHSANNTAWLSVEALRAAIRTHVDPGFAVG